MKFNPYDFEPKPLVSDSIKDLLPEDQLQEVDHMFISIGLVMEPRDTSLTGNLVAIEFGEVMKIDIKLTLKEAFSFIGNVISNSRHNKKSSNLLLLLGEDDINIPGPFKISGVKIVEIDSANKLCVLGIDLNKDTQ